MYKIITVRISCLIATLEHNRNTAVFHLQLLEITTVVIWGGTQA